MITVRSTTFRLGSTAAAMAAVSSGRALIRIGLPPQSSIIAPSPKLTESKICSGAARVPGGTISLPVASTATRGWRVTLTAPTPAAAMSAT